MNPCIHWDKVYKNIYYGPYNITSIPNIKAFLKTFRKTLVLSSTMLYFYDEGVIVYFYISFIVVILSYTCYTFSENMFSYTKHLISGKHLHIIEEPKLKKEF